MRVANQSGQEMEAIPVSPAMLLLRGGATRPRLLPVELAWEGARWLTERRRRGSERRGVPRPHLSRRREDLVPLETDISAAALDRKLADRRRFLREAR